MITTSVRGPRSRLDPASAYRRPPAPRPVVLKLDGNEGARPGAGLFEALTRAGPELLRRYPEVAALEAALARRFGVASERVVLTAGADEAIDRCCRAFLEPGRSLLLPQPSFEMIDRYAALAGGEPVRIPWRQDRFPTEEFLARIDARTAVIAIVSPNNPTGGVATLEDVERIARAAPEALVLLDHAYVEYADEDLTIAAARFDNVVVTRTFSKARGLAGCRVGYALAGPYVAAVLRCAGGPYPVASPSVALAALQLETGGAALAAHLARVREERAILTARLASLGLAPRASQANFVFVECGMRAARVYAGLAEHGVLVRSFPDRPGLEGALRITLPGDPEDFALLLSVLGAVMPSVAPAAAVPSPSERQEVLP
jgi:histidinol-phosphate aminotransferase